MFLNPASVGLQQSPKALIHYSFFFCYNFLCDDQSRA
jgi:hypothetical protein